MKKTVLFVILDKFSDWESAYVSTLLLFLGQDNFEVKTVSLTKDRIHSLGGLTVLPDYDLRSVPEDYEGLILIGGLSWRDESAGQVEPLVYQAYHKKKVLGGICDAAGFLGTIGLLNQVSHTCNDLDDLKKWAGEAYTGEEKHLRQPAVRDQNMVTANGTAPLEFAKEVLLALHVAPEDKILEWYKFHKLGSCQISMPGMVSEVKRRRR